MGNPFQDQLLKAGLVNKKQVNKLKHEQRINRQQNTVENPSDESIKAKQELLAHEERNRELNRQHNEAMRQREKLAQVKQIIETNRLVRDDRGEPYYFTVGNRIKKLFVSDEMTNQLSWGQLAIVRLDNSYEIVTAKVANQIASRDKDAVVVFHQAVKEYEL
ncbi:MAG: DUF2058 domain-containing protein [Desulfamplus sp.]|nr:DUF2058 domain-containing protein [Desulfamplus sp.]